MRRPEFNAFCSEVDAGHKKTVRVEAIGNSLRVWNTTGGSFDFPYDDAVRVLTRWLEKNTEIQEFIENHPDYAGRGPWHYKEAVYRAAILSSFFSEPQFASFVALGRSQSRSVMLALNKLVGAALGNRHCGPADALLFDEESLRSFLQRTTAFSDAASAENPGDAIVDAFTRLCAFTRDYNAASAVGWKSNDLRVVQAQRDLSTMSDWISDSLLSAVSVEIIPTFSKGVGWFPKIPWICLLAPGQAVSDGVFASFCFGKEGAGAVAGFAESVQNRKGLPVVKRSGGPMRVDVDGGDGNVRYNDSFVNPREFLVDSFEPAALLEHLRESLQLCFEHLRLTTRFGAAELERFSTALTDCGFKSQGRLARNFVAAVATKPFLILCGNSGTGKTKLAELFASWLQGDGDRRHSLIAVGADWTDSRNVVGFVNHLRDSALHTKGDARLPIYQSTAILNLLLQASKPENNHRPFFLILDEMNLSHVERYFADFLSAIESSDSALQLHGEGASLARTADGIGDVADLLKFPPNVFVIGTVNVDETTYMFSPKVLDRANVLEFRVAENAPAAFLAGGGKSIASVDPAPVGYAEAFLELSFRARSVGAAEPLTLIRDGGPPDDATDAVAGLTTCGEAIADLFAIMQERRQEFAFRTMTEIMRFLAVDYELTAERDDWGWRSAMDAQILQKILPKLHGSKRKIAALLSALAKYCEAGSRDDALKLLGSDTDSDGYPAETGKRFPTPAYKESHRKLCEMIVTLRRDQFVSFIQ